VSSVDVSLCEVDDVAQAWLTANSVAGTPCSTMTVTVAFDGNTGIEREGGLPLQAGDHAEILADTSGPTLSAVSISAEAQH
jgi:hypothetical protein